MGKVPAREGVGTHASAGKAFRQVNCPVLHGSIAEAGHLPRPLCRSLALQSLRVGAFKA